MTVEAINTCASSYAAMHGALRCHGVAHVQCCAVLCTWTTGLCVRHIGVCLLVALGVRARLPLQHVSH